MKPSVCWGRGRGRVVFSTVVFDGDSGKFGKNPNFTSTSLEKEAKGNSEKWPIPLFALTKGYKRPKCQLSKSITVVNRSLSTRLIKPNFHVSVFQRSSTTVSLESRNLSTLRKYPDPDEHRIYKHYLYS